MSSNPVEIQKGVFVEASDIQKFLGPQLTEARRKRISAVVRHRSFDVVPVLENLYDRGNVSAVMRSAESFGYVKFGVIERKEAKFKVANRTAAGTDKWIELEKFEETTSCLQKLKTEGFQIWATSLTAPQSIDKVDFTRPTAVIFGNEKEGVSEEALALADGRFRLPMYGFAESFNISVAAALTFAHIFNHRKHLPLLSEKEQERLECEYILKSVSHPLEILERRRGSEASLQP